MGTTADKLSYLLNTKNAIRDSLIAKGVSVPAGTPFRLYANKISMISGEGSGTTIIASSSANYDGGASGTKYLSTQKINGGYSDNSGDLSPQIKIDGGSANG